jgi:hypothetical protein
MRLVQLQAQPIGKDQRQILDNADDPIGINRLTLRVELVVKKMLPLQPAHRGHQFGAEVILSIEKKAREMGGALNAFDGVALAWLHAGRWGNHHEILRSVGPVVEERGGKRVPSR